VASFQQRVDAKVSLWHRPAAPTRPSGPNSRRLGKSQM